jgi:hypothetical protein
LNFDRLLLRKKAKSCWKFVNVLVKFAKTLKLLLLKINIMYRFKLFIIIDWCGWLVVCNLFGSVVALYFQFHVFFTLASVMVYILFLHLASVGIYMHLHRVYFTQLWFSHWPFHLSSSNWYTRKISFRWVSISDIFIDFISITYYVFNLC